MIPATIARHESKFPVPLRRLDALIDDISVFCEADRHATTGPDGLYTIDSLYFDSDDFILYQLTETDAAIRSKVRVRTYLSPAGRSDKAKLEVKFKRGPIVTKTSASVPTAQWRQCLEDPVAAPPMPDAESQDAFDKFAMEVLRYRVHPRLMVRYQRAAFFSRLEDYVRITFDRRIQAQPHRTPDFETREADWFDIDLARQADQDSSVIMECKFQQAPPRWLVDVLRRHGLVQASFSKYGQAVRRLHQRSVRLGLVGRHMRMSPGWPGIGVR
jgi:SPX domain protein involved in polyphosphate accumulation